MPTIYITSAKARYPVKDTSQTGLVFLKDCLHIENDSVFNLLVDVSKIDCVWFAPDDEIVNLFQQKPGVNILEMNCKHFLGKFCKNQPTNRLGIVYKGRPTIFGLL